MSITRPIAGRITQPIARALNAPGVGGGAAPQFGENLATNGDFATGDLTGWVNASTGTASITVSSGAAQIAGTSSANRAILKKSFPTTVGETYVVSLTLTLTSGSALFGFRDVEAFSPPGDQQIQISTQPTGEFAFTLTATSATTWLQIWTPSGGGSFSISAVQIRQVLPITADVFIVCGQSNAEGRGALANAVDCPLGNGWIYRNKISLRLLEPVGSPTHSSAWPAFANRWRDSTGRVVFLVEQALGATGLLAATGSPNWSSTGTLRSDAVTAANAASAILAASGFTVGKVFLLWQQGEQDAALYNGTTITDTAYQAEQEALFSYWLANITNLEAILVSELGTTNSGTGAAEYTLIRNAQNAAISATADCYLAFSGAKNFPAQGKMIDNVHYNQVGLTEMGQAFADYAQTLL